MILEGAGLVVTEKVGRSRHCRLGPADLDDAAGWIAAHKRAWAARVDRFADFVERSEP